MGKTTISWSNYTFNPWEGCEPISPACDNCYAARRDRRLYAGEHWTTPKRLYHDRMAYWKQLDYWNYEAAQKREGRRVFVGSLMDIFERSNNTQDQYRQRLWERIPQLPWLTFLLTTKRPQYAQPCLPLEWRRQAPKNVWIIVTAESNDYLWRVADAQTIGCPVAISAEPLLGPLDLDAVLAKRQAQWIIGGGESGPGARITETSWATGLRDQAQAAGIPFHWKQWGEWAPTSQAPEGKIALQSTGRAIAADYTELYGRYGAGASGRSIDGREWLEFPEFWTPETHTVRNGSTADERRALACQGEEPPAVHPPSSEELGYADDDAVCRMDHVDRVDREVFDHAVVNVMDATGCSEDEARAAVLSEVQP